MQFQHGIEISASHLDDDAPGLRDGELVAVGFAAGQAGDRRIQFQAPAAAQRRARRQVGTGGGQPEQAAVVRAQPAGDHGVGARLQHGRDPGVGAVAAIVVLQRHPVAAQLQHRVEVLAAQVDGDAAGLRHAQLVLALAAAQGAMHDAAIQRQRAAVAQAYAVRQRAAAHGQLEHAVRLADGLRAQGVGTRLQRHAQARVQSLAAVVVAGRHAVALQFERGIELAGAHVDHVVAGLADIEPVAPGVAAQEIDDVGPGAQRGIATMDLQRLRLEPERAEGAGAAAAHRDLVSPLLAGHQRQPGGGIGRVAALARGGSGHRVALVQHDQLRAQCAAGLETHRLAGIELDGVDDAAATVAVVEAVGGGDLAADAGADGERLGRGVGGLSQGSLRRQRQGEQEGGVLHRMSSVVQGGGRALAVRPAGGI
jgi:hypothetical protein